MCISKRNYRPITCFCGYIFYLPQDWDGPTFSASSHMPLEINPWYEKKTQKLLVALCVCVSPYIPPSISPPSVHFSSFPPFLLPLLEYSSTGFLTL